MMLACVRGYASAWRPPVVNCGQVRRGLRRASSMEAVIKPTRPFVNDFLLCALCASSYAPSLSVPAN